MDIAVNRTKARLKQGKVAFGLQVRFVDTIAIARAAATSGYHYLFIDLEHSTMDVDTVSQICIASLDAGVTPTVRIPEGDFHMASRLLDGGAQGIVVPHVNTAEDAANAVRHCLFPPTGKRSYGGTPVQLGWKSIPVKQATELLNDNLQITVTIESVEAVDNIDAIAAVSGVDAIAVGSNDLLLDMGLPGQFDHPRLWESYTRIIAAGNRNGVAVRLGGSFDPAFLKRTVEAGARMVSVSSDLRFLLEIMRSRVADISSALPAELVAA